MGRMVTRKEKTETPKVDDNLALLPLFQRERERERDRDRDRERQRERERETDRQTERVVVEYFDTCNVIHHIFHIH